ncbi:MAG: PIG-L family deacetylase [bacterium]|nr:PIG-L family deacetylase [bacterium]
MSVTNRDEIKQLGTILCVFAHPDDETFTMGGIMAAAVQNGQQVICVTATRGELGVQDDKKWPLQNLADIRTSELSEALKILGVQHHYWLDFPDGGCENVDADQAVSRIVDLVWQYQPDSIMTFGPDGLTGHLDHQAVSAWTTRANAQANSQAQIYHALLTTKQYEESRVLDNALNFYWNTPKPPTCEEDEADVCLHLSENLSQIKLSALRAMPSQYQAMFEQFDESVIKQCSKTEAFIRAI